MQHLSSSKMKMNLVLVLLSMIPLILGASAQVQCGKDAGGAECPNNLCCSQWGYCGSTPAYCGEGCQSQCSLNGSILGASAQVQCGKDAGGAECPNNLCCSQWGYCGSTPAYCGEGCQSHCSLSASILGASAQAQCGKDAGGAMCPNNLCCSRWGYCGSTPAYCGDGCQSQCSLSGTTPTPSGDISSLVPESLFNEMLKHRSDPACEGRFYTYNAFIEAARSFSAFASVGDSNLRKREIAAFFAQTSHETTGGWAAAPDGPFAWGYCFIREQGSPGVYCSPNAQWPCAPNKRYYGRGPIQISWNYNYGQAGKALGLDLLNNPDLVSSNPTISFKTALWFWMTPQAPKPSSHNVITGRWTPSNADATAGRVPGFGVITNIINGGLECGHGPDDRVANRIGFYRRYCNLLGVTPGDNLDCYNQKPFGSNAVVDAVMEGGVGLDKYI